MIINDNNNYVLSKSKIYIFYIQFLKIKQNKVHSLRIFQKLFLAPIVKPIHAGVYNYKRKYKPEITSIFY